MRFKSIHNGHQSRPLHNIWRIVCSAANDSTSFFSNLRYKISVIRHRSFAAYGFETTCAKSDVVPAHMPTRIAAVSQPCAH